MTAPVSASADAIVRALCGRTGLSIKGHVAHARREVLAEITSTSDGAGAPRPDGGDSDGEGGSP